MKLLPAHFLRIGLALVMVGSVGLALTTTQSSQPASLGVDTSLVRGGPRVGRTGSGVECALRMKVTAMTRSVPTLPRAH
jgi:hypothetical protein